MVHSVTCPWPNPPEGPLYGDNETLTNEKEVICTFTV
jgi:hypothetical protein